MGLFNRKQSKNNRTDKEKMDDLASQVRDFIKNKENDNISISFIMTDNSDGYSIIKGDADHLVDAFLNTVEKDRHFKSLMAKVNAKLLHDSKKSNDDKFFKGMSPEKISLPNGQKGIAIDGDNLTEENVDKIVEMIIKSNQGRGDES